jgi:hypothetical protein
VKRSALLVFLAACGGPPAPATPRASAALAPELRADVDAGVAKYRAALEKFGRWEEDATWGVRFCPYDVAGETGRFEPYRTHGHWQAGGKGARWVADRPGSWRDVTTHAGWWVLRQATDEWCWIPGAETHDGRVGWRAGRGFVGWAPLSPLGAAGDMPPDRAWSYTFLGLVYEKWLSSLTGEAWDTARASTLPKPGAPPMYLMAPRAEAVKRARDALEAHVMAQGAPLGDDGELPAAMALWALVSERPMAGAFAVDTSAAARKKAAGGDDRPKIESKPPTPFDWPMPFELPGMDGMPGGMPGLDGLPGGMLLPPGLVPGGAPKKGAPLKGPAGI